MLLVRNIVWLIVVYQFHRSWRWLTSLFVVDVPAARVPAVCFVCLEVPQFRFIDRVADFPVMIQRLVRWCEHREESSVQFFSRVADARFCVTTGAGNGRATRGDFTGAVLGQVVRRRVASVAVFSTVVAMMRSSGV